MPLPLGYIWAPEVIHLWRRGRATVSHLEGRSDRWQTSLLFLLPSLLFGWERQMLQFILHPLNNWNCRKGKGACVWKQIGR